MIKIIMLSVISSLFLFSCATWQIIDYSSSDLIEENWELHRIDTPPFSLPNGLDPADVNQDGFPDFITNYEWDGYIRVAFYPGIEKVKEPWPAITIAISPNAESAAFGDFDGDKNPDAVIAHGEEFFNKSGIQIIWGPNAENALNPDAWINGGNIPSSEGLGHYHYIKSRDINGDGVVDIIVGGRGVNPKAGLKWFEAPLQKAERKDLSKWILHYIDSDLESGHGFTFGDLDNDGDDDIVVCNSDWDTKDKDEMIVWYENPGNGTETQKQAWPKNILYQGPEFYTKEQVDIEDLNQDGNQDIIVHTIENIYYFRNNGTIPVSFEHIIIPKITEAQHRCRPIKITDLNRDGKWDILGMLIHHDGALPKEKAAVFWMEYEGDKPESDNWKTHIIKWGDNFPGFGTWNGEKWDQIFIYDIDQDGDPDIVANCEEYNQFNRVFLAVVWFENKMKE